jgi:hypothetical protein
VIALDYGGDCNGHMRIFGPRFIIPAVRLLAGLVMFGYIALWIAAVMFSPD